MMIARHHHQHHEDLPQSVRQNDRLVMLIERLRDILQRQIAERDTSIDWEDGEVRGDDSRH
jgi:hypothetical protein